MIHEWTQRPHIAEWWQTSAGVTDLEICYFPPIGALPDTMKAYVAEYDRAPIGFIQSYVVMGSGGGWWEDEKDPGARGMDQYLAIPAIIALFAAMPRPALYRLAKS